MINKLPENFTLELVNSKITNLETVIPAIKNEINVELLEEYLNFLNKNIYNNQYDGIEKVINALKSQIAYLKQTPTELESLINLIQNTYVELKEVLPIFSKYTNKEYMTDDEFIKMYSYLSNAISLYENDFTNSLTKEEKEILHYVMEYVTTNEYNLLEKHLIERYNKACEKEIETSGKSNNHVKRKINSEFPISLSEDGVSLTIIIITATVVIGTIIAMLMLVK